jgi:hypothetical protein
MRERERERDKARLVRTYERERERGKIRLVRTYEEQSVSSENIGEAKYDW